MFSASNFMNHIDYEYQHHCIIRDLRTNIKSVTPRPPVVTQQITTTPTTIVNNFHKKNINGNINGIAAIAAAAAALSNGSLSDNKSPQIHQGQTLKTPLTTSTATTPTQQQQQQLMCDVSDMLYEFYKANTAKAPKTVKQDKIARQQSPSSADGATGMVTSTPALTITPTKQAKCEKDTEPTSTTTATASKNLNGDEMVALNKKLNTPFHPRIKYSNFNNKSVSNTPPPQPLQSPPIPTSNGNQQSVITSSPANLIDTNAIATTANIKPPIIVIPSSVIQSTPTLPAPPAAAALAAALFRDGYQNFTQQIRAQGQLLKQHRDGAKNSGESVGPPQFPTKYMNNFLRKDSRYSENDQSTDEERDDEDLDDDHKYPEIDDIHLMEGSKLNTGNISGGSGPNSNFPPPDHLSISMDTDYISDESHKYSMIAAHALRNLEYSLNEFGSNNGLNQSGNNGGGNNSGDESSYNCRHCGKKYRWKSTLRRHENVECGGKEPSHQCPYCPYKSKQRGNLGVHVRKHHADLPQLVSKRRSKYSTPRD